jgi:hypothetical protein
VVVEREGWLPRSIRAEVRDLIGRATADRPEAAPRFISTIRPTVLGAAVWRGCKSLCVEVAAGGQGELQLPALAAAQQGAWLLLQTIDG